LEPERKNGPSHLLVLCDEPFRIFFPLGIAASLIGVSHWLWYFAGLTESYSCIYHGLIQIQGFELSFATGFIMTALPRFLETKRATPVEVFLGALLAILGVLCLYQELWFEAQVCTILLVLNLSLFAIRRYRARKDELPSTFYLIFFGVIHALLGGILILWPIQGFVKLGHKMVEQGMMLCFILAAGPYLGPRLMGTKEVDLSVTAKSVLVNMATGTLLMASFWIETGWSSQIGVLIRAAVVTTRGLTSIHMHLPGSKPLWHLRFLRISFWCVAGGLWLAAIFPDYDILSLHMTFIGGFSLLTFLIATRIISSHCGFEDLWGRNTKSGITLGITFILAVASRMASDFFTDYYFGMLHIASGFWLTGALTWAIVFLPKLLPWHISKED
jgi:uncharacterized protein involved in response to NO